jgi:putative acetyltransferase
VTVAITPADLDDPRVAALLDDHLTEMEPTAPPESRHARGQGVGRLLLDHALAQARRAGATRVSLETGVAPVFDPARSLYAAAGFTPCEPFGDYRPDRHSTFLTVEL